MTPRKHWMSSPHSGGSQIPAVLQEATRLRTLAHANAVGIGEIGGEFDLRGKPFLFPKLASIHNDIIASAGVISKEHKLKMRLTASG